MARARAVPADWFQTLDDRIWLPPDDKGEEEAAFIRRHLRLRRGQRVLDAPCGAGRIAYHLARAGCRVTGVDIRPQFLRRGRRRFRREGLADDFRVLDLRRLDEDAQFHGIYNWFGSFGYFSDADNAEVVARFGRALRPGGRLLVEQVNRERILRHFRAEGEAGGVVTRNRWDPDSQRVLNERTIDGVRDPANDSSMRLYTPRQMEALLTAAGLRVEGILDYPAGGPFRRGSRRMVAVARRP